MTPEEACRNASQGEVAPVTLVLGEEDFLRTQVVQALKTAVLAGGVPGLNEDSFVAGEQDLEAIFTSAKTSPMLAKRRFVLVRSLERWEPSTTKSTNDNLDRLAQYAEDPTTSTALVLVAGKLDGRRRLVTAAKRGGWLVTCSAPSQGTLQRWIEGQAAERGVRFASGISDMIVELSGPGLAGLADAIERLSLYVGPGQLVDEDAVSTCLARMRNGTVWQLVGAIGRQDVAGAWAALDSVYDPQDRGLKLLGVIAWSTRQLLKFESAFRAGHNPAQAAQLAGAPPFKARELADQVRRIPRRELERWLEVLARTDLALKGGSRRTPRAVLEHAILALCRPTPRSSRSSVGPPA